MLGHDFEVVRDFLALHYHATEGRSQPLWEHTRRMALPDSLVYREEHFRRTGRIVLGSDELFRDASWFAVMMGQGVLPCGYNPLVDVYSAADNRAHLAQVKQAIAAAAPRLPTHGEFIRDHRAAPVLAAA